MGHHKTEIGSVRGINRWFAIIFFSSKFAPYKLCACTKKKKKSQKQIQIQIIIPNYKTNKVSSGGFYLMSSLDKSKSSSTVGLSSVMAGTSLVCISTRWLPSSVDRSTFPESNVSGIYLLDGLSSCCTFTTCSDVLLSSNKNLLNRETITEIQYYKL